MRSENLLPGSQYYNYFISGSLALRFFLRGATGDYDYFSPSFSFLLPFFVRGRPLPLFRVTTASSIKVSRFVGERIHGIRMTNRATFRGRARSINRAGTGGKGIIL